MQKLPRHHSSTRPTTAKKSPLLPRTRGKDMIWRFRDRNDPQRFAACISLPRCRKDTQPFVKDDETVARDWSVQVKREIDAIHDWLAAQLQKRAIQARAETDKTFDGARSILRWLQEDGAIFGALCAQLCRWTPDDQKSSLERLESVDDQLAWLRFRAESILYQGADPVRQGDDPASRRERKPWDEDAIRLFEQSTDKNKNKNSGNLHGVEPNYQRRFAQCADAIRDVVDLLQETSRSPQIPR